MTAEDKRIGDYYGIGNIFEKIETGLKAAGKDIEALTVDDLLPIDEFHTRGRKATREVAQLADIKTSDRILDVGCGLGGTARFLAQQYKCSVVGIDLTPEYIIVGSKLTALVDLQDRVKLAQGSALDIPYENEYFDAVWTQHVQMNIADKKRFYSEIARVLKPGGCFLFHDVFSNSGQPPIYPTPWAENESLSVMVTEAQAQAIFSEVGLKVEQWIEKVPESVAFFDGVLARLEAKGYPPLGIHLLLGDNAIDKFRNYARNLRENRMAVIIGSARKS